MAFTAHFWSSLGLCAVLLASARAPPPKPEPPTTPVFTTRWWVSATPPPRPQVLTRAPRSQVSMAGASGDVGAQPPHENRLQVSLQTMTEMDSLNLMPDDVSVMPFDSLRDRHCLPDDYDWTPALSVAELCYKRFMYYKPAPKDCSDVSSVSQSYNCFANSAGQLVMVNGELTFNVTDLEVFLGTRTSDAEWNRAQTERDLGCKQKAMGSLGPQQRAVYSYTCAMLSLFANCDRQRTGKYDMDELSMIKRTMFLEGLCPTSPNAVQDIFGPLLAECAHHVYTGDDVQKRYSSAVARVVCLLKDFQNSDGSLDVSRLMAAISDKFAGSPPESLLSLGETCGSSGGHSVTAEEFVHCWAGEGIVDCVSFEANLVALTVPETCVITSDY